MEVAVDKDEDTLTTTLAARGQVGTEKRAHAIIAIKRGLRTADDQARHHLLVVPAQKDWAKEGKPTKQSEEDRQRDVVGDAFAQCALVEEDVKVIVVPGRRISNPLEL